MFIVSRFGLLIRSIGHLGWSQMGYRWSFETSDVTWSRKSPSSTHKIQCRSIVTDVQMYRFAKSQFTHDVHLM